MGRERDMATAALINLSFTLIEIVGGLLTNSLAIIADALHDFGDSATLLASWFLARSHPQDLDSLAGNPCWKGWC